jgi:hypothetical protein
MTRGLGYTGAVRALAIFAGSILALAGVIRDHGSAVARATFPTLSPQAPLLGGTPANAGSTRTETRPVGSFHRIALKAVGNLEVRQGPSEALSITADERVLSEIVSRVSEGTLELTLRSETQLPGAKDIRYAVTVKSLDGLHVSGVGRADLIDLKSDTLDVSLSGSGDIALTRLDAGSLAIKISGTGSVTASGRTDRQQVQLSGVGTYAARELASKEAIVHLSGSGRMVVKVERELDATVSGAGDIEYYGSPTVKRKVSGIGRIRPG